MYNKAYYKKYFKIDSESNAKNPTVEFDYSEVRKMHKSFLDSAIIELCLPGSKFSPQALYTCLNAIEEESPKELGRCPQAMWDAVGDLAVCDNFLRIVRFINHSVICRKPFVYTI